MNQNSLYEMPTPTATTDDTSAKRKQNGFKKTALQNFANEKGRLSSSDPLGRPLPPPPKRQKLSDSALQASGNEVRGPKKKANPSFTPPEDRVVVRLYESLGNQWSLYEQHLPNRVAKNIKQRFERLRKLLKFLPGSTLLEKYIVLDVGRALRRKGARFWSKADGDILSYIRQAHSNDWNVISKRLGERRTMEAMKVHCQKIFTAVLQVSAPPAPQLSPPDCEVVLCQPSVPGSSGIAGKQTSVSELHLRQEKPRMHVSSVSRNSSIPIEKTVPASPTVPAPSVRVHPAMETVKISERLSARKSSEKTLGAHSRSKVQSEMKEGSHIYANAAEESATSASDQLAIARRENLALRRAFWQSSNLGREGLSKTSLRASQPTMLETPNPDVHGLNPFVQAILRCEKASAWSASAMSALPSEMSCARNEPNLAMDSLDFDVAVGALLQHIARVLGAPSPFEASTFLFFHEQAENRISILVENGILNVLTAAVRLGETAKLHFILSQFVQQTFEHLLDGGTDLHWIHLFADEFLGPLLRWPRAPASFVKELESLCIILLTKSGELLKSKCALEFARGQEICMAMCEVHPAIAKGLPVATREALSASPMYAAFEVMSLTQLDLENLLINQ